MILARNLAIVALLALGLTMLPGGGNLAEGIVAALSLVLIAAVGISIVRFWAEISFTRDVLSDQQQVVFYSALGALALMIVGMNELLDSGLGALAWLAIVGGSIAALVVTWRASNSY